MFATLPSRIPESRREVVRVALLLLLWITLATLSAGCARTSVRVVEHIPRPPASEIENVAAPTSRILQPIRGSEAISEDIVRELATAGTDEAQARRAFAGLRTGNLYDQLFANATCTGMEWLAEQPKDTRISEEAWQAFLHEYPAAYAQAVAKDEILGYLDEGEWLGRVDGAMTAWDIAQVSPSEARMYWRACVAL